MTRSPLRAALRGLPCAVVAMLAACSTWNVAADFAKNEQLYVDVPFRTKAPGDRALFVAPVRDARNAALLPTQENGYPIAYGTDDVWERPVVDMVADIVQRQLEDSGLFTAVAEAPSAETLVLRPSLVTWTTGSQEAMSGSRTFAEVGLRLEVLGPAGKDGTRPVWHDQVYGNRQVSELSFKPISPYRLVGRALQVAMAGALSGLDGSNIGRSNVPVDVLAPATSSPAEASSARR